MQKRRICETKASLSDAIFDAMDVERAKAAAIMEDFIELVKEALESEGRVMLSRFGCLMVKSKRPRRGINPQTKDAITLRARKVVRFKPSPLLRRAVNGEVVGDDEEDDGSY